MSESFNQYAIKVMSGEARGLRAALLRAAMAIGEPIYTRAIQLGNGLYDSRMLRADLLPCPVICVGNVTTGGTGKTPVVIWLARQLREQGKHPAILLRGYKSRDGVSDEQRLIDSSLNQDAERNRDGAYLFPVRAGADRVKSGRAVLQERPETDVILLDDGFQHRNLARDFDLVLIDATNPFGFERVLPRGLLREPLSGLNRASAFLITRVDQAPTDRINEIVSELKRRNELAPIFQSKHVMNAVITQDGARLPLSELRGRKLFAFCGIGNPGSFMQQLEAAGATIIGGKAFADHHHYGLADLAALGNGADALITTEKDWVKIESFASKLSAPVWRASVSIEFTAGDDHRLLEQIQLAMAGSKSSVQAAG